MNGLLVVKSYVIQAFLSIFVDMHTRTNMEVIAGLFDFSAESDFVGREIVKCIDLAKDGIHAVLIVYSVRTRFSQEEGAALRSL